MSNNKPKLVVLNSNYPSKENLYGAVFVHSRLKHYLNNFEILVIGYRPFEADKTYTYEGIDVQNYQNKNAFVQAIHQFNPDIMGIHFASGWFYNAFLKNIRIPVFIWIHGEEALGWYRRLYYFSYKNIGKLVIFALKNIYQLSQMRRIISLSNQKGLIRFILISEWMKRITETDTLSTLKHATIIPNPIDSSLFRYVPKEQRHVKKILLIRSFETNKYANDIAIEAIGLLKNKPYFESLQFDIYGRGQFWKKLTNPVKNLPNVHLNNYFLENHLIPAAHKEAGIFLCPTRQDAQGVSMCEAMSSGLVPITSHNTAIPEFVEHGKTGFLTNNAQEIADAIDLLVNDDTRFLQMSAAASAAIQQKSGHKHVIDEELKLLWEGIKKK